MKTSFLGKSECHAYQILIGSRFFILFFIYKYTTKFMDVSVDNQWLTSFEDISKHANV